MNAYYQELGPEFEKALNDMYIFDALIFNTDRHYGNFGFLVDSHSNQILAPAPLFDHGNSLLNFAGADALKDHASIERYAGTQVPCVYDDFIAEAKRAMDHEQKSQVRRLLNFRFRRHSRYNLEANRLALVEYAVQRRAEKLLNE